MLDVKNVYRKGRGRVFQFYATDEEVDGIFAHGLPGNLGPYSIIAIVNRKVSGNQYEEVLREAPLDGFSGLRSEGLWSFFIRSHVVTASIDKDGGQVAAFLSLSGLVNLQQGRLSKGAIANSSIGIVDRVCNEVTGEESHHSEYLKVFQSMKKALRKLCIYRSQWKWLDGRLQVSATPDVTEGFARRVREHTINTKISIVE